MAGTFARKTVVASNLHLAYTCQRRSEKGKKEFGECESVPGHSPTFVSLVEDIARLTSMYAPIALLVFSERSMLRGEHNRAKKMSDNQATRQSRLHLFERDMSC